MPPSRYVTLVVEVPIDGSITPSLLDHRHALEDLLDKELNSLGLGHLDGGSVGSGTMEVMCEVVSFTIAKAAITRALQGTPFANFSQIYRMP